MGLFPKLRPLLALMGLFLLGAADPMMVESKVQIDLENALGRMIPREQFLIQVNAEIGQKIERKLVEGETFKTTVPTNEVAPPMPGFTVEPQDRPDEPAPQERQVYRLVERPELTLVRVQVSFDDALDPDIVYKAKVCIRDYLQANYPSKTALYFASLPMLKPLKLDEKYQKRETASKNDSWIDERWKPYLPWFAAIFLGMVILILMLRSPRTPAAAPQQLRRRSRPRENAAPNWSDAIRQAAALGNGFRSPINSGAPSGITDSSEGMRRKLLNRFLARSQAFRLYYAKQPPEIQAELWGALAGPGFEGLMEGLGLKPPRNHEATGQADEEALGEQLKDFDEFVEAKEWQDRQFFGFLHHLTNEQLGALIRQESPETACVMLRYMRPQQSAAILEHLPPAHRKQILAQIPAVEKISLNQISLLEREIRARVKEMPSQAFGSKKDDLEFWGTVLTEANDQDGILSDLEITNPDLSPNLKKYRFKLEDAAALPNTLIEKVFSQVENEELAGAISTCPEDVADVLLDAVSGRRREYLMGQMDSLRNAPPEEKMAARMAVTRRFREVMS